jgi:hypothetical protein
MLSAATAAVLAGPAVAAGPTTITTVQDKVVATSTTGDLTINTGGGIKGGSSTAALITIDSSNTVLNSGVLTATANATAVGYVIDASKNATGSVDNDGTLDITAGGTGNRGIYFSAVNGLGSFTGPVLFDTTSVVKIVGDTSTAMYFDAGTVLNGDVTMEGTVTMTRASGSSNTSTSSIGIGQFLGTINGNVTLDGTLSAVGSGVSGIAVLGSIHGCNTTAVPGCTQIGTLSNSGTLSVNGITTRNINGVNPESDAALVVEGSVAGGIMNNGPTVSGDTTTVASISANGTTNPTVLIEAPTTAAAPLVIGVDSLDTNAPTSSFINRGVISASPVDPVNSTVHITHAMVISGQSNAAVNFTGDFFNSGLIAASITTTTPLPANSTTATATALEIQNYVNIPDLHISGQSSGVFNGAGQIAASASGTAGSLVAEAILISGAPITGNTAITTVPKISIDTGASVTASAAFQPTANDTTGQNIISLFAAAIVDNSNSLHELDNAGTISAIVTQNLATSIPVIARAVDVSGDASVGLNFNNTGTVVGDVAFGGGNDVYSVTGSGSSKLATQTGEVDFGAGTDQLIVGQFANVSGIITSQGSLSVTVAQNGILTVQNVLNAQTATAQNLTVTSLVVAGATGAATGTLNITVSQDTVIGTPVINSTGVVTLGSGANFGIKYGSFIPASTAADGSSLFTLIKAPAGDLSISAADLARYNGQVSGQNLPFLFQDANLALNTVNGSDLLQLRIAPKTVDELGLTGYGRQVFPFANIALANDNDLGAAMVTGINSKKDAQKAYDAFAPNASGGERAIAISLTDQATGIVAARLRELRLFAKESGDLTLWGHEFAEELSNKGQTKGTVDGPETLNGYKDHGFGFSLGLDGGSPEGGWYGGAFTFYTGDVQEGGDRVSRLNSLWYLLTGYSEWRGRGLFFESQVNVGYASFKGKRFLTLDIPGTPATPTTPAIPSSTFTREADSNRPGLVGSIGATAGALLNYGSTKIIPQISLDGMTFREEGYTESNGGQGFDLKVNPYYANSLRIFVGSEFREDLNLGDFLLQPSARVGYRFDFLNDPVKLHAAFADVDPKSLGNQAGESFIVTGPDPGQGNIVLGGALNATTENWTFGLNYDFVRGSNNATQQIGTISLLGRI